MVSYGHFGLLDSRFKNDKVAKRVAKACANANRNGYKMIVVGHSNGCAIAHRAATRYDAQIEHAIYINPALEKSLVPGPQVRRVDVWHSPSDKPVRWSKWLPAANARPWGEMGAVGYKGGDVRIRNFNKEDDYAAVSSGHSDMFLVEQLAYFGPVVVAAVVREIWPEAVTLAA